MATTVAALDNRKRRMGVVDDEPLTVLRRFPTAVYEYRVEVEREDAAFRPQGEPHILWTSVAGVLPAEVGGTQFVMGIRKVANEPLRAREEASPVGAFGRRRVRAPEVRTASYYYRATGHTEGAFVGLYVPKLAEITRPRNEEEVPSRAKLHAEDQGGLNGRGSRPGGYVCPRNWRVYKAKPPQVSLAAWEKVSAHTRNEHRRALEDQSNMSHDLLQYDLAAAAIRLIHRAARMRNWKASTIVSKFATMHGALANLPLYTDQTRPINLKESPEWTAAYGRWHQVMASEIPHPPPHATYDQVQRAARELYDSPPARLFLRMMWSFAARPGDI